MMRKLQIRSIVSQNLSDYLGLFIKKVRVFHFAIPFSQNFHTENIRTEDRFDRIPVKSRKQLAYFSTSDFLIDLENEIENYLKFCHNQHKYNSTSEEEEEEDLSSSPLSDVDLDEQYTSNSTTFKSYLQNGKLVVYLQVISPSPSCGW
jgi:hypothetical protein